MPVETLLISGPPKAGKSGLACLIAEHVLDRSAHFVRMRPAPDGHSNVIVAMGEADAKFCAETTWRSSHHVLYTPDRVFETLPDGLRAVRAVDRYGFAILEADTDPALRHAYPYDYRVFVMRPPECVEEVFRDASEAAHALQQVMQDTASFASEIFGLFDASALSDDRGVFHQQPAPLAGTKEWIEHLEIGEAQIRGFLNSPLGVEIAARIQLQPAFHAMVESDVVVINTSNRSGSDVVKEMVRRVEKLLSRVRHDARRHSVLYWGNLCDIQDPARHRLLDRLRILVGLRS